MTADPCLHCGIDVAAPDPTHRPGCPFTTGLWPASGDEVCWRCHDPIDGVYVLAGEMTAWPGIGLVTCVGCGAELAATG